MNKNIAYIDVTCVEDILDIAEHHKITKWRSEVPLSDFNPFDSAVQSGQKIAIIINDDVLLYNDSNMPRDKNIPIVKYNPTERKLKEFLEIL